MSQTPAEAKQPFEITIALERVRTAIAPFPKAAMFELYERGHTSLFAQLVGCMLSIRTLDEVVLPVSLRLLERAPDAAAMARLEVAEIETLIASVTFAGQKAHRIRALAEKALSDHGGEPPCDPVALQEFSGIGPKCAHLSLGIACEVPYISVDIHVHRICNRWGYVAATTPEKTLKALEAVLPQLHWIEINSLLVPFGKHICTGNRPKCSQCPLEP
ncbi:MAG: endonuclease III, partial [Candidatus Sericytochromatia bacterium]